MSIVCINVCAFVLFADQSKLVLLSRIALAHLATLQLSYDRKLPTFTRNRVDLCCRCGSDLERNARPQEEVTAMYILYTKKILLVKYCACA